MRTGRPRRGIVEQGLNIAQVTHLRGCLGLDGVGLRRWLQRLDSSEGGLLERHARAFVDGDQAASAERVVKLERHAPGLIELTQWPWVAFDSSRCTERALRAHQRRMERLTAPVYRACSSEVRPEDPRVTCSTEWELARHFFAALVSFQLLEKKHDQIGMAARGGMLLGSFEGALRHPAIAAAECVVLPVLERALTTSILVSAYSFGRRHSFRRRRLDRLLLAGR
jgi:hypothetical protein